MLQAAQFIRSGSLDGAEDRLLAGLRLGADRRAPTRLRGVTDEMFLQEHNVMAVTGVQICHDAQVIEDNSEIEEGRSTSGSF